MTTPPAKPALGGPCPPSTESTIRVPSESRINPNPRSDQHASNSSINSTSANLPMDLTMSWTDVIPSRPNSSAGPTNPHTGSGLDTEEDDLESSSMSSLTSLDSSSYPSVIHARARGESSPERLLHTGSTHLATTNDGSETSSIGSLSDERGTVSAGESASASEDEDEDGDGINGGRSGDGESGSDDEDEESRARMFGRTGMMKGNRGGNTGVSSDPSFWADATIQPLSLSINDTTGWIGTYSHSHSHSHSISPPPSGFSSYIDGEQYTDTTASSSTNRLLRKGQQAFIRPQTSSKSMSGLGLGSCSRGTSKDHTHGQSVMSERFGDDLVWPSWPLSSGGMEGECIIHPSERFGQDASPTAPMIDRATQDHKTKDTNANAIVNAWPHHRASIKSTSFGHNFRADVGSVDRGRVDHELGVGIGLVGPEYEQTKAERLSVGPDLVDSFVEVGKGDTAGNELRREFSRSSGGSEAWTDDLDEDREPSLLPGRTQTEPALSRRLNSRVREIDQNWLDGLVDSASIAPSHVVLDPDPTAGDINVDIGSSTKPYEWIFAIDQYPLDDTLSATLVSSGLLDPDWPFSKETIEKYTLYGGVLDQRVEGDTTTASSRTGSSKVDQAKKIALLALPILVLGIWATISPEVSTGALFDGRLSLLRKSSGSMKEYAPVPTTRGPSHAAPVRDPPQYNFIRSHAAQTSTTAGHDVLSTRQYYPEGSYDWHPNSLSVQAERSLAVRQLAGSFPRWSCRFGPRSRASNCSSTRARRYSHSTLVGAHLDHGLGRGNAGDTGVRRFVHSFNLSHASAMVTLPLVALVAYGDHALDAAKDLVLRLRSYVRRLSSVAGVSIVQERIKSVRPSLARLGHRATKFANKGGVALRAILDDIASLRYSLLRLALIEPGELIKAKLKESAMVLSDVHLRASLGQGWDTIGESVGSATGSLRDKLDHVQVSLPIPRLHLLDKAWKRAKLDERFRKAYSAVEHEVALHVARSDVQSAMRHLSLRMGEIVTNGETALSEARHVARDGFRDVRTGLKGTLTQSATILDARTGIRTTTPMADREEGHRTKRDMRNVKSGWQDSLLQALHHTGVMFVR